MKTVRLCDSCNSVITTIKRGKSISVECSYCGEPYDSNLEIDDFISDEKYGEDNEE